MSNEFENPYAAPETSSEHVSLDEAGELAGRGTRLVAAILDTVLLLILLVPAMFVTGYMDRAMRQEVGWPEMLLQSALGIGLYLLMHGYTLATRGQSLGKVLLGIQIVDENSRQILSFGRLVGLRLLPIWVIALVPIIGNLFGLIDSLMIFSSRRQCLHDRIAGTLVIIKPRA